MEVDLKGLRMIVDPTQRELAHQMYQQLIFHLHSDHKKRTTPKRDKK